VIECEGYLKLKKAVLRDQEKEHGFHDYEAKLNWIIARAEHYAKKTGIPAERILDAWEKERDYWYMNFYQDCNQPLLDAKNVRVFDTMDDLKAAIGNKGFRCPACGGISKSPYECDSGIELEKGKICDWKVYGLLGDLGKGVFVFVKSEIKGNRIFMPIGWII
jgi:hypothetical protein